MINSPQNVFLLMSSSWSQLFAAKNIVVAPRLSFSPGHFERTLLDEIRKTGVRVVITVAYSDDVVQIALDAEEQGMTSPGWAWISTDTLPGAELAAHTSTRKRAKIALFGWLYIWHAQSKLPGLAQFYQQVKTFGKRQFGLNISSVDPYAAQLYDSVYLYAHAATQVLAAGGAVNNGTAIVQAMLNISFEGIEQKTVKLDSNGDAIEPYSVMNYVEQGDGEMRGVEVGQYVSGELKLRVAEIRWPGNVSRVPSDMRGTPCILAHESCL